TMACRRYAAIRRVPDGTRNGGRAKQGLKPLPIPAPSRWDGKTATVEFRQTPGAGLPPAKTPSLLRSHEEHEDKSKMWFCAHFAIEALRSDFVSFVPSW
ncbi:MAG: hypothetical protein WC708_09085, partial [Lentisphaeria bacterium]